MYHILAIRKSPLYIGNLLYILYWFFFSQYK